MKKDKLRYTEHKIDFSPNDTEGGVKLIITHVIISPMRLINEVSYKIVFLEHKAILEVIMYSIGINTGFILWATIMTCISPNNYSFISFPVLIISIILLFALYFKTLKINNFVYSISSELKSESDTTLEEENISLSPEPSKTEIFEEVKASPVFFDDPINIFIKSPAELITMGINPAVYQEAEESRFLNGIEKRNNLFLDNSTIASDVFEESLVMPQMDNKFLELINDLESQIKNT